MNVPIVGGLNYQNNNSSTVRRTNLNGSNLTSIPKDIKNPEKETLFKTLFGAGNTDETEAFGCIDSEEITLFGGINADEIEELFTEEEIEVPSGNNEDAFFGRINFDKNLLFGEINTEKCQKSFNDNENKVEIPLEDYQEILLGRVSTKEIQELFGE